MEESDLSALEYILFPVVDTQTGKMTPEYSLDKGHCSVNLLIAPLDFEHAPVALNRNGRLQFLLALLFCLTKYQAWFVSLWGITYFRS